MVVVGGSVGWGGYRGCGVVVVTGQSKRGEIDFVGEWVRYELQEIYEIGNSDDNVVVASGTAKDCLIEPRDTIFLPCRHMVLRHRTNWFLVCMQPVERLLEIKVNHEADE
ncbi:hypothetical protein GQ457_06G025890 [Hibiscus cannabinus]